MDVQLYWGKPSVPCGVGLQCYLHLLYPMSTWTEIMRFAPGLREIGYVQENALQRPLQV